VESLLQEHGYEIHRGEDSVLLLDRNTWLMGYITGILGVAAFLLVALGLLVLFGAADTMSDVSAFIMLAVSIGFFVIGSILTRFSKRRSAIPIAEVAHRLTLDSRAGVLQDSGGNALASLDSVRVGDHFDWSTRGMMRVVVLRWPGGRRTVFRTIRRARAREIVQMLNGISSPES